MRCIEIEVSIDTILKDYPININMRCIEIALNAWVDSNYNRLTLTWDVLKSFLGHMVYILGEININMRCIEIGLQYTSIYQEAD